MEVAFFHAAVGACLALMVYVGTLVAPRGTPSTVFVAFVSGAALSALASRLLKPPPNLERTEDTTTLLIIDPQNDFHPGGSLAIPTADEDAERIAARGDDVYGLTTGVGVRKNRTVSADDLRAFNRRIGIGSGRIAAGGFH